MYGHEDREIAIRLAAFEYLNEARARQGGDDVFHRDFLRSGFPFGGDRIRMVGPKGIFKPRQTVLPLSITTVPETHRRERPYNDQVRDDAILYRYRGTDPFHPDNQGLRELMRRQWPLVYFHGIVPGWYLAIYPVYIVGDDPRQLTFTVQADMAVSREDLLASAREDPEPRRRYITTQVLHRVHQRSFRERVLAAYRKHCAICRLRHPELLDAAHIIPDREGGRPVVPNGLALCKIHHAAFDRHILGITPDYRVEIRMDILHETDGPMLKHGLQELHGCRLVLPHRRQDRPDPDLLDQRYQRFLTA